MYRLVDQKNVCIGKRNLIVVGDVNLFTIFRAFDENIKAKLKCVKYVLHELSYLPCALPYRFIFSSETNYMTLGESEKAGAIFWVMVC